MAKVLLLQIFCLAVVVFGLGGEITKLAEENLATSKENLVVQELILEELRTLNEGEG